nr:hypothetical protein CFP56_03925 [Quercus suber]
MTVRWVQQSLPPLVRISRWMSLMHRVDTDSALVQFTSNLNHVIRYRVSSHAQLLFPMVQCQHLQSSLDQVVPSTIMTSRDLIRSVEEARILGDCLRTPGLDMLRYACQLDQHRPWNNRFDVSASTLSDWYFVSLTLKASSRRWIRICPQSVSDFPQVLVLKASSQSLHAREQICC